MVESSFLLAIAGGSGAGKTTFARRLVEALGEERCGVLSLDSYYLDQSPRFVEGASEANFDHPDSLDFRLLADNLRDLREGRVAEVPIFDRATHTRRKEPEDFPPKPVVLIDGILLLSRPEVRAQLDASIYIDVPEALRFERRLRRDVAERGRAPEGVKKQWETQVQPMHEQFVEPSKMYATWISGEDDGLSRCMDEVRRRAGV